jgi:peptide-methionine (S)-S-oxide reductase
MRLALFMIYRTLILILLTSLVNACAVTRSEPAVDVRQLAPFENEENRGELHTAVLAGGCFWGVEAVFEHLKGVSDVRSGYSGGDAKTARYDKVSAGKTEHAEAVKIPYDPAQISYVQLLTIFFSVAHDPTQLNRQGPDVGRHYRSAIFFTSEEQRRLATEFIERLNTSKTFGRPVVTELVPLTQFYDAEEYHQDYMRKNPDQPYIVVHDKPKVEDLKKRFPELLKN